MTIHVTASAVVTTCGLPVPDSERDEIIGDTSPLIPVIIASDDPDEWLGHLFCDVCRDVAQIVTA